MHLGQSSPSPSERSWLSACPARLALLGKRLWSFDKVLRRKQSLQAWAILAHGLFDGQVQSREGGLFGELHTQGGTLQDLVGPALGCGQEWGGGNDLVDQTQAVGLLRGDLPPGEQQAHGLLERDLRGQAMHTTRPSNEAHARFGLAEACMLGGDDEIARQCDLETSAKSKAIDCRYNGFVALEATCDPTERNQQERRLLSPGVRCGRCFEIVAG